MKKLAKFLKSVGITSEVANFVAADINVNKYNEDTMVEKANAFIIYFQSLGYTIRDINIIFKGYSSILCVSFDRIKRLFNNFFEYDFTLEQVVKMSIKHPRIFMASSKKIDLFYEEFRKLGLDDEKIKRIILADPSSISRKDSFYKEELDFFTQYYSKEEFMKITSLNPNFFHYSNQKFISIIEFFINRGYTKEQALKIFLKFPKILHLGLDNIESKESYFKGLGFSDEEIRGIIIACPNIISYRIDLIEEHVILLKKYFKENYKRVVALFPASLQSDLERLNNRLKLLQDFNLLDHILRIPKDLMLRTELIYARMCFLEGTKEGYNPNHVFISQVYFKKMYGKDNETLIKMYPYDEDSPRILEKDSN